jgi:hypothetical protein
MLTEKRLRLVEHVLRHFTAAYDGVAMAAGEPGEAERRLRGEGGHSRGEPGKRAEVGEAAT